MKGTRWTAVAIMLAALMLLPEVGAHAQEYRLGPGDVLDVAVFGETDLTRTVTVRPDGKISLPLVGDVPVVGLTADELAANLTSALQAYLRNPKVTVVVSQARPAKIYLVGQVRNPGSYDMRVGWTALEAITQAGGITDRAYARKAVVIRRQTGESIPLDLDRLIVHGDQSANVVLEEGDVILVPEFQNRVLVLGNVKSPGAFDLKEGARVLDAIAAAGGPSDHAGLASVGVVRQGTGGQPTLTTVNVQQTVQVGDQKGNVLLQHGDVVFVPRSGDITWRDTMQFFTDILIMRTLFGF